MERPVQEGTHPFWTHILQIVMEDRLRRLAVFSRTTLPLQIMTVLRLRSLCLLLLAPSPTAPLTASHTAFLLACTSILVPIHAHHPA